MPLVGNRCNKSEKKSRTLPGRFTSHIKKALNVFGRVAEKPAIQIDLASISTISRPSIPRPVSVRPLTRSSVRTHLSMRAWNMTSILSHDFHRPVTPKKQYTLHIARDHLAPSRSGSVSTCSTFPDTEEQSDDVKSYAGLLLPELKHFAGSSRDLLENESWDQYLDRVFQPEACQIVGRRRLSYTELDSPIESIGGDAMIIDPHKSLTEDEMKIIDTAVVGHAQDGKCGKAEKITIVKKKSMRDLRKVYTYSKQVEDTTALETLPYQAFVPGLSIFKHFHKSTDSLLVPLDDSKSDTVSFKSLSKSVHANSELHLPSAVLTDLVAAKPVYNEKHDANKSTKDAGSYESPSCVDMPDAQNEEPTPRKSKSLKRSSIYVQKDKRPSFKRDSSAGVLTRNITGAKSTTPGRYVMIDHYPRWSTEIKEASTPRVVSTPSSIPVPTNTATTPVRPVTAARTSTSSNRVSTADSKAAYEEDVANGVLTRLISGARNTTPRRVAMNDSGFPIFMRPLSTTSTSTTSPVSKIPVVVPQIIVTHPSASAQHRGTNDNGRAVKSAHSESGKEMQMHDVVAKKKSLKRTAGDCLDNDDGESKKRKMVYRDVIVNKRALARLESRDQAIVRSEDRQKRIIEDVQTVCDWMGI